MASLSVDDMTDTIDAKDCERRRSERHDSVCNPEPCGNRSSCSPKNKQTADKKDKFDASDRSANRKSVEKEFGLGRC